MNEQKLKLKNCQAREARWKEKFEDKLLELEEEDHNDLVHMMENHKAPEIPQDMKILWEQQQKILQTSYKKGYRWHPKLVLKYCYIIVIG